MPKLVDHDVRRAEIAAALGRVIERAGMREVSVRTVAAEAGLSVGAMRHYFGSQDELLRFAVEDMSTSIRERVAARSARAGGPPFAIDELVAILEEAVPLDARRRAEFEVWLELVLLARTSSALRQVAEEAHGALRDMCAQLVLAARRDDRTTAAALRDPLIRREVDVVHALLDGLSMHLALYPEATSRARVRDALREHPIRAD